MSTYCTSFDGYYRSPYVGFWPRRLPFYGRGRGFGLGIGLGGFRSFGIGGGVYLPILK